MENNFKFYNTLSRQVENVIPNEDGKIVYMWTNCVSFCTYRKYPFLHYGGCS